MNKSVKIDGLLFNIPEEVDIFSGCYEWWVIDYKLYIAEKINKNVLFTVSYCTG